MYRKSKRVFDGLAGSPLAKLLKQSAQKSDFSLRVARTPDRDDPIILDPLTVWIDQYGQTHGAIDDDCAFQTCAFDPHLGNGAQPEGTEHVPSHAGAAKMSIARGFATGLLEGERPIKMRRSTSATAWILDRKLFKEYLLDVRDRKGADAAVMAADVLYEYYYCNREDLDVWYKFHWRYWDTANKPSVQEMIAEQASESHEKQGALEVKSFRQYHQRCGAKFAAPLLPSRSPARRVFIVRYFFDGRGHNGEFVDGAIVHTERTLADYIIQLQTLREKQGFNTQILTRYDRLFANFKKATDHILAAGLTFADRDRLAELVAQ